MIGSILLVKKKCVLKCENYNSNGDEVTVVVVKTKSITRIACMQISMLVLVKKENRNICHQFAFYAWNFSSASPILLSISIFLSSSVKECAWNGKKLRRRCSWKKEKYYNMIMVIQTKLNRWLRYMYVCILILYSKNEIVAMHLSFCRSISVTIYVCMISKANTFEHSQFSVALLLLCIVLYVCTYKKTLNSRWKVVDVLRFTFQSNNKWRSITRNQVKDTMMREERLLNSLNQIECTSSGEERKRELRAYRIYTIVIFTCTFTI